MNDNVPSNIVRTYIAGVKPYLGKPYDLVRFLTEIDDIVPVIANLSELEILIRFKQILSKLEEKARNILHEDPTTWDQVRALLVRNFADNTDIGTLIVNMERITYQGSIQRTYDALLRAQVRMFERIELGNDPMEEKIILKRSVKRRTYMHFRKSLPQACQGALTSRNCETINDAIQILHDEEFLTYNRYHEDNRSPQNNDQYNRYNNNSRPQRQQNHVTDRPNYRNQNTGNNQFNYRNQDVAHNRPNFQNQNNPRPHQNNPRPYQNNPRPYQNNPRQHQNFQPNYSRQQRAPWNNQNNNSQQYRQQPSNAIPQPRQEPMEVDQNFHLMASADPTTR